MDKKILISQTSRETRLAILESGELVEFFVEKPDKSRLVGNIYKGKIENVVKGIQAAFVDIGMEQNAFLPFSEISDPELVNTLMQNIQKKRPYHQRLTRKSRNDNAKESGEIKLASGQDILVQVIKEPFAGKGPRVTTDIAIPGRFLVLVPNANYVGISKKIRHRGEKSRLRKIAHEIKPKGFGVIIRTVADSQDRKSLRSDLDNLFATWKQLEEKVRNSENIECVYTDMETTSSVIRDLLTPDVDKIIIDNKGLYKKLQAYIKSVSPEFIKKMAYYHSRQPLFDHYNVEKQFQKSLNKKIWLKNGGFIVIEHTEAMTTVDVNSGKFVGRKDHEKTSLKTNVLAAREIARQLRLRDIGGLIVIDFIDMEVEENKRKISGELKKELSRDKAKVSLLPISDFGLLEMTRERTRPHLLYTVSEECPLCHGSGRIPSKATLVTRIEGWFRRFKPHRETGRKLILHCHPELAEYIKSGAKNLFRKIQWKYFLRVKIHEDPHLNLDEFKVYSQKQKTDITDEY